MPLLVAAFSLTGAQTLPVLGLQQERSKQHSRFLGVLSVVTSNAKPGEVPRSQTCHSAQRSKPLPAGPSLTSSCQHWGRRGRDEPWGWETGVSIPKGCPQSSQLPSLLRSPSAECRPFSTNCSQCRCREGWRVPAAPGGMRAAPASLGPSVIRRTLLSVHRDTAGASPGRGPRGSERLQRNAVSPAGRPPPSRCVPGPLVPRRTARRGRRAAEHRGPARPRRRRAAAAPRSCAPGRRASRPPPRRGPALSPRSAASAAPPLPPPPLPPSPPPAPCAPSSSPPRPARAPGARRKHRPAPPPVAGGARPSAAEQIPRVAER